MKYLAGLGGQYNYSQPTLIVNPKLEAYKNSTAIDDSRIETTAGDASTAANTIEERAQKIESIEGYEI